MKSGIYKITNKINQHSYVGTSINIERRWQTHLQRYNNPDDKEYNKALYRAFRKYGVTNFDFVILELLDNYQEEWAIREQYWIKYYNTYNDGYNETLGGETGPGLKGEDHHNSKLQERDIIDIRTRYNNKERCKEVYNLYKDRINESGFSKIWKGETWTHVMMYVYTEDNKIFHKHNTGQIGSTNGRAKLTEDDVRQIRIRRKNGESLNLVYKDYSQLTWGSFKNIWYYCNWKHVTV